ncbi:hypothetical protein B0P06_006118 [Clostridium saccharoperbutylacetonicum]|uniref:Virion structural protein n=1 Tax=Clostridium saccharoperbutylacetonicum N1-4(HMT) TaxID=931276 RepID=M1MU31_9CLOT|nr:hypothetical protein [Clostridium saccharoperbutylacetonicum]AGF59608.1 virion structural protein [Clostridium saccharoperbutylacetonicum N1-4(HMT)]NRT64535.1 hypothetical protein [Clostridium saccharoperbutylacetonicum]NSB29010.1 hypothetical protein [Clostridium saccharoperbutylacetonicum]NSB46225.1 hypothetical protein [Clostridium saccharoperbutylacetonicum]
MRIDKKNDATYTKELDEMEKYFLNMFKRFIENDPGFLDKSVESIITEAVKRAKKEIIFEKASGVLSINNMSGVVKLTLDDLNGEPKIPTKYSAFNRPFGTDSGTVCEGNDPRLSDARIPLPHNHNDLYYRKSELVTHTEDGYMDKLDKIKLDGIEANANFYIHPIGRGYNHIPVGGASGQYLKWHSDGEAEWADVALNKVTETADGIMSKEDKIKLDGIEANVKNYIHPTGSGYNHIPSGGNSDQILEWKADGDAQWKSKPCGNNGQVYYIKGNSSSEITPGYILYKATIIETDKELEDAKVTLIDPSVIYNTWYRFSHDSSESQPAVTSETTGWVYDSDKKKIICQNNSISYIGFISPEKYDNYNLEVTISSTDMDNDAIGSVIAFTKDAAGREYTLSVVRMRSFESHVLVENISTQYAIVYNYNRSDEKLISYYSISSDTVGNWADIPNGIRLKIIRDGDKITTYSSDMNSTTVSAYNKIDIDLNSNELLSKFKGPCQYGYSCLSQMYSSFSDIKFDKDNKYIYDSRTNSTWMVDVAGNWSIDSSKKVSSELGIGKFVFNEVTKKLYYINDSDNIISFNSDYIKKSELNSYLDNYLKSKGVIS